MRALYAEACLRACRRSSDIRLLSTRRRRAGRLLSGLRVPFSLPVLLFCLVVSTSLSAPCPLKDHVALSSLSFINGMAVPSCVVAPVRAWCIYAAVFVHYRLQDSEWASYEAQRQRGPVCTPGSGSPRCPGAAAPFSNPPRPGLRLARRRPRRRARARWRRGPGTAAVAWIQPPARA